MGQSVIECDHGSHVAVVWNRTVTNAVMRGMLRAICGCVCSRVAPKAGVKMCHIFNLLLEVSHHDVYFSKTLSRIHIVSRFVSSPLKFLVKLVLVLILKLYMCMIVCIYARRQPPGVLRSVEWQFRTDVT